MEWQFGICWTSSSWIMWLWIGLRLRCATHVCKQMQRYAWPRYWATLRYDTYKSKNMPHIRTFYTWHIKYIDFVHKCIFGSAALRKSIGHELAPKCPNAKFFTSEPENGVFHVLEPFRLLNLSNCNSCGFFILSCRTFCQWNTSACKQTFHTTGSMWRKYFSYLQLKSLISFVTAWVLRCKQEVPESLLTNDHLSLGPQVYIDGSSVAAKPTELCFLWAPEILRGCYAPPCVGEPDAYLSSGFVGQNSDMPVAVMFFCLKVWGRSDSLLSQCFFPLSHFQFKAD